MSKVKYTQRTAELTSAVDDAFNELEELQNEMGEWRDSLEEKLSHTGKYQEVSDAHDALESAVSNREEPGELPELTIVWQEGRKASKKSPFPRWLRRDNALNILGGAVDALNLHLEGLGEDADTSEIDDYISMLESVISEAEGIEFPRMFG